MMFIVKKIVVTLCLLSALAVVAVGQAPQAQMNASMAGPTQETKSLYQRLGGYDAIAAVVDEFITRLATDPRFQRFFSGFSNDSKKIGTPPRNIWSQLWTSTKFPMRKRTTC